jgi:Tfp pilus assembly protein FimT
MTPVELMVVVVILGILAAVAIPSLRASSYGGGVLGYAHQIDGLIDEGRARAVATQRWHRLVVQQRTVVLDQASTEGMVEPEEWQEVRYLQARDNVEAYALGATTTLDPGSAPKQGERLGEEILFSPDGSASAATIFLQRAGGVEPMRVTIVRATAASYVYSGW